MKKVDLFKADKTFAGEVAEFMVKALWRKEFKLELDAEIEKQKNSISGLENCRGSIIPDAEIDAEIKEKEALIERLKATHKTVCDEWVRFKASDEVKESYKAYKSGRMVEGFVTLLTAKGLEVDKDTNIVRDLVKAVSGDSGRDNTSQVVNIGKCAVETRTAAEYERIVYRRLADLMIDAGTIRISGTTVKGGGKDIAEFCVEIPEELRKKYAEKAKKNK